VGEEVVRLEGEILVEQEEEGTDEDWGFH